MTRANARSAAVPVMHSLFENISFGSATDNNGKHENGTQ
jgi:hypothetical protein